MSGIATKPNRYQLRVERRKKRDAKIRAHYNNLYHEERLRIDDVEKEVSEFWDLSIDTIRGIMSGKY